MQRNGSKRVKFGPAILWTLALPAATCGCGPQKPTAAIVDTHPTASARESLPIPMTPESALVALRALRAKVEASADVRPRPSEYEQAARALAAAGVEARVVVLEGSGYPRALGATRAVISVRDHVADEMSVLELELSGDPLHVGARRLLPESGGRLMAAGPSSFLVNTGNGFLLYPSIDAKPIQIDADNVAPSNGALAFKHGPDVFVIEAATGHEIFPPTAMDGGGYPEWKNGGKWLTNCTPMVGGGATLVLDVAANKVLFRSESHEDATPAGCALDADLRELAIVYSKDLKTSWLETWSLDTGKRLAKKPLKAFPADLEVEIDAEKNAVNIRSAPFRMGSVIKERYDAKTGAALPVPASSPAKTQPKGDPLAHLPVGDASPFTSLPDFGRLATPNYQIDTPSFLEGVSGAMTATGVLSQDKATLALFESAAPAKAAGGIDPANIDVALLLVDTKTMKVKTRVAPPHVHTYEWAAMRFLDPKTVVFHFNEQHWLVDVETGAVLATTDYREGEFEYEMPTLLTPSIVAAGQFLVEVRRNGTTAEGRPLVTPYWSSQGAALDSRALKSGDLDKITVDHGKLTTPAGTSVPPYVSCVVGEEVFPVEVCSAWR